MSLSKSDQDFVNSMISEEVMAEFVDQTHRLATGQRKRATLPNSDNEFQPLEGLRDRLEKIHASPAMKHAVDYSARDD